MAEGIYDLHQCLKEHSKRIVDRLYDWNILGPKTLLGHCIYINEHEMDLIKDTDTMVVQDVYKRQTVGGGICFLLSLALIVYSLIQYFTGHAVEGYTTIMMVLLLIGSAIMLSLGIIGYYIAKIYEEIKRRPRYIISQIIRGSKDVSEHARHDSV